MLSISIRTPREQQVLISKRLRSLRISHNMKRASLAKMSGVSESSIKRFELTGEISLRFLLELANALGVLEQFDELFAFPVAASLGEIERQEKFMQAASSRKRGRR